MTPDRRPGRRQDVLRALQAAPAPLSIAELARQLAVHPNTVRFHLDTLLASGQAESSPPQHRGPGRPPLLFRAARRMDPGGPRRYRMLAEILVGSLATDPDPSARAVTAGRAWGRQLATQPDRGDDSNPAGIEEPVSRLVSLLGELNFAPDLLPADDEVRVGLRHCPFLELAESRTQVVCPIHLGLMQGAMAAWEAPVTVDRLEAFAEPDLCVAHLAPAGDGS